MIRVLRDDDVPAVVRVAGVGGSPDADTEHFAFVAGAGRVLVAVDDVDGVIGVAGSLPVGSAAMVTDLFVDERHRGEGLGRRLLGAATDGAWRRFTFSSTHPAALPTYRHAGMEARWQLLTMRGAGLGRGGHGAVPPAPATSWRHDRADLVAYLAARGAEVGECHVATRRTELLSVHRLVGDRAAEHLERLLRSVSHDVPVELSIAEHDPLVAWLVGHGFEVVDVDVYCASAGVDFPPTVRCVHRGLC